VKAVVHDRYGPPEVLRLEKVEQPVPRDDEVLVKIHATTVSRTDCAFRRAKPFVVGTIHGPQRVEANLVGKSDPIEKEASLQPNGIAFGIHTPTLIR
jgi:hypothetical protein